MKISRQSILLSSQNLVREGCVDTHKEVGCAEKGENKCVREPGPWEVGTGAQLGWSRQRGVVPSSLLTCFLDATSECCTPYWHLETNHGGNSDTLAVRVRVYPSGTVAVIDQPTIHSIETTGKSWQFYLSIVWILVQKHISLCQILYEVLGKYLTGFSRPRLLYCIGKRNYLKPPGKRNSRVIT